MKVKVISVADDSFTGNEGNTIPAASLTFEVNGERKTLKTYIPPVVTTALSWQPDQEVEIEEYTDKKGNQRFKTPSGGGRQGGGGKGFTPDPLRYATEAAVSLAQTAWRIPDGSPRRESAEADDAAHAMLAFVELAAPRILKAIQNGAAQPPAPDAGVTPPPARPVATAGESSPLSPAQDEPAVANGRCVDKAHVGPIVPAPNPDAAKRGLVMCQACKEAGHKDKFGLQEALV